MKRWTGGSLVKTKTQKGDITKIQEDYFRKRPREGNHSITDFFPQSLDVQILENDQQKILTRRTFPSTDVPHKSKSDLIDL
jgi:hypothetical protein